MLTGEILRRSAARFPGREAIVAGDRRMTYRELDEAANRFANALIAEGLEKGDKAAILSTNHPAYAVAYFGAAKAGVVLANLSVRATVDDVRYMLDKAEVRLFLVEAPYLETAAEAAADSATLKRIVVIGDGIEPSGPDAVAFDDFLAGQPADEPGVALTDTDPLAITFTGGTTGKAKAVLVSHRARFANNLTGAIQFGLCETDRAAVATPMFHAAGLLIWFQLCVFLGLTCVLIPSWDAEAFIEATEQEGVTAVFLVPTQIRDLVEHPAFDAAKLETLRSIDFAGAPMPVNLSRTIMGKLPGLILTEHLGQSETGPIAIRQSWDPLDKIGAVGRQPIGVDTRVVDPDGNPVQPGEIGEIVTRGDHLLTEYYKDPEQTAALYRSGDDWLWTGDLATIDEDGFITLVDRSKDMIISGGENIYPKEIEIALYDHEAVSECAVFGIPDERFGEVPAAHVVLRNGAEASEDELVEFCADRIARFKRPRMIKFVAEIPKTPLGKIQKHLIRAPYWEGHERKI